MINTRAFESGLARAMLERALQDDLIKEVLREVGRELKEKV